MKNPTGMLLPAGLIAEVGSSQISSLGLFGSACASNESRRGIKYLSDFWNNWVVMACFHSQIKLQ